MNKQVKAEWLASLIHGNYKQGRVWLRDCENSFCPLGVLCNIYSETFGIDWYYHKNSKEWYLLGEKYRLPLPVKNWAGISGRVPVLKADNALTTISYINDLMGFNFKEIAELINQQM